MKAGLLKKISWRGVFNILTWILVLYLGARVATNYWKDQQTEGLLAEQFTVPLLDNQPYALSQKSEPLILVFWATWCGPCDVELARINKMIQDQEIETDSVLAVSVQETPSTVAQAVRERGYLFPVGLDESGRIAQSYQVNGTPTIVFLNSDRTVAWRTTGISLTLSYRIRGFLKSRK
jgi:cytochrome c biogenesis protein CcmG/thiol:disulfide interchange protein DsbE